MKFTQSTTAVLLLSLFSLLGFALPVQPFSPDDEEQSSEDEDEDEDEKDEEEEKWFAVIGGDVYTGTGEILRGATVLAKNGVIEQIGYDLYLPEETETLEAAGMRVYPGLVALSASSRVAKGTFAPEASDGSQVERDSFPSHVETDEDGHGELEAEFATDVGDSFDPFSSYLVLALSAGITTADQGGAAVKLKRNEIEDVVMNADPFASMSWSRRNPSSIRGLREKFKTASSYLREYRAWEEAKKKDKELKEPSRKGVDTSVLAVLRCEKMARFTAEERDDLLGIARLAQEFGFRPLIQGCREGWTVADELGRAGAFAIVTPRDRRTKEETLVRPGGSSIENASLLHGHGIQVAVVPASTAISLGGITGRDLLHLPIEAAFAVRGGLSNQAALESITLIPARILGVDHRVGTLEVGKDCDLIVTDGDILHYETFVQYTVVAGAIAYDKEEEIYFAHIRPRPEPVVDPGEEVEEEVAAEEEAAEESAEEEDESDSDEESEEEDSEGDGSEEEEEAEDEGSEEKDGEDSEGD